MNAEMQALYQEVILDHSRQPRNRGTLPGCACHADGFNPLCGDEIHLDAEVEGGVIRRVRHEGHGCAISTASASLMSERVEGMEVHAFEALFEEVHGVVTGQREAREDLGKLQALAGVARFPMRVKCAVLPWHALRSALQGEAAPVTTE